MPHPFQHGSIILAGCLALSLILNSLAAESGPKVDPDSPDAIGLDTLASAKTGADWFRQSRLGMMICWSPAVAPKSVWSEMGMDVSMASGDPSWYFNRLRVPVAKWETLAPRFNPKHFDADAWVKLARDAGIKYLIFTAKHHDGFAMYDSACSDYDVIDRTPFKRDPLRDLAAACRRYGVRLCLYYSQAQDWHHPDGANNHWAYDPAKKEFARYFREKCLPQVRELMSHYGPIGLFWFDTPVEMTRAQCEELYALVKSLQPDCLVNSRIGQGVGDYMSMGDSAFPETVMQGLWETATTTCTHWYYAEGDKPRMTADQMVRYLAGNVSRGGNVAFNIGPDYDGVIPAGTAEQFLAFGKWMQQSGESIYECGPTPFLSAFDWGTATTRPGFVYLHVFRWPGSKLELNGLTNTVLRASLLANDAVLKFRQIPDCGSGICSLQIELPETPLNPADTVIKLKIAGEAGIQPFAVPQNGVLRLDAWLAGGEVKRHGIGTTTATAPFAKLISQGHEPAFRLNEYGVGNLDNWLSTNEWISWTFRVPQAGSYEAYIVTSASFVPRDGKRKWLWDGGHKVELQLGERRIAGVVRSEKNLPAAVNVHPRFDRASRLGTIAIAAPGEHTATLRLIAPAQGAGVGLTLRAVVLLPAAQAQNRDG